MALGSLFAFNEARVGVPGDIALAGVDDISMARFVTPPLTTVRVRMAELGLAAAIEVRTPRPHRLRRCPRSWWCGNPVGHDEHPHCTRARPDRAGPPSGDASDFDRGSI
jgi:hypothetical protein